MDFPERSDHSHQHTSPITSFSETRSRAIRAGRGNYHGTVAKQTKAADGVVPTEPNPARVYDYFLGGKDNYRVDRLVAQRVTAAMPEVQEGARATRAVLGRVVRFLVRDAGISQLLDIGAGLPTRDNVHEIARRTDPAARVVYVDNDPVVLAHAKALLADNPATVAADGDLRDPGGIIGHPLVRGHLTGPGQSACYSAASCRRSLTTSARMKSRPC